MSRIKTKEDFIRKANELYNNRYDYSEVDYVKSSVKVRIICPEHGVFEKTPNKHLMGQGCPICGRNRTRTGTDMFIEKAKVLHGDTYDYSLVEYVNNTTKVKIICPVHGLFEQTPHSHVVLGHNCPKCSSIAGGQKRFGDNNVAHRDEVKRKKRETCLERYGTGTYAESEEGRKKLHDVIVSEKLDIMKATCQERYGTDFWTQSDEGRQKLHEIMSSEAMQLKVVEGYVNKYGMHYMQTNEGKAKAREYIDDERQKKMRQSMIEHYGVPYPVFSEKQRKDMVAKSCVTKRKNGTFNTSKPEKTLKSLLQDVFGKDDVKTQYRDERYPFCCDFYITSLDLFIELNAHWSHGGHWFDETNSDDIKLLSVWLEKSKQRGSRYYHVAIDVWTHRDLLKKQIAEDNGLNYVVFWDNNLQDAREFLLSFMEVVYDEIAE